MPPRLAHRKSRQGCTRCKERKVKCNEGRPACTACARHGVACEYIPVLQPVRRRAHHSATGVRRGPTTPSETKTSQRLNHDATNADSAGQTPDSGLGNSMSPMLGDLTCSQYSSSQPDPKERRHAIELFLMHRFTADVVASFPSSRCEVSKDMFPWHVPNLACDHAFLFQAIFAITALYLCKTMGSATAATAPNEPKGIPDVFRHVDFAHLHRLYLHESIQQQRTAFECLGPTNADALGLTSALMTLMAICISPDAEQMVKPRRDPGYRLPLEWLKLSNSSKTVFEACFVHLEEGSLLLNYVSRKRVPDMTDSDYIFDPVHTKPFKHILEFHPRIAGPSAGASAEHDPRLEDDVEVKDAYVRTLELIGSTYASVVNNDPPHVICSRISGFGPLVPRRYIELLSLQTPRAMVILAHYMALVRHIEDDFWWFQGIPEREIIGIKSILPQQWHWLLAWPSAVLESPLKANLDPGPLKKLPVPSLVYQRRA
ncbi:hypothetical protein PV10_00077 [Exophiala mesophila]|uniref:Zn(2)-C6 fungal-type domain-containing protein n=1 Tax=Exophiala mesophila TaxID=212818 RepID=A0A0D2AB64_EXOME|nr:uncharacterized protein PV10_00077 [Exophiala mesophila]KIV96178.1 hypothetical protein PV10_00077 [Exophiala mesophila]